jgi:hypothetical protein
MPEINTGKSLHSYVYIESCISYFDLSRLYYLQKEFCISDNLLIKLISSVLMKHVILKPLFYNSNFIFRYAF